MFQIRSWPETILHVDGDAFFASVAQAVDPRLKGKPVVTGQERGIATAISYEAKKYGIKRGMRFVEMKKMCPNCIFVRSDYELYSLYSHRLFEILRQFSPSVEEYSIDEGFLDLKGLRSPHHMGYEEMGRKIKNMIESNLGITISLGISVTKSLAKIASDFHKPSGLTVIDGKNIETFLKKIPIQKVWGIGEQTSAYLRKLSIHTAFDFVSQSEEFVQSHLSKPFFEIYQELRGKKIYELNLEKKTTYQSISKTQTFHPPTMDKDILWARLLAHIEDAFIKARTYNYRVEKVHMFLKTQSFLYHATENKLKNQTQYPFLIRNELEKAFNKIYHPHVLYRTTGCTITNLKEDANTQQGLFQNLHLEHKVKKIYPFIETKKIDFGTSLFDKEEIQEKKVKPKPSIPFLDLSLIST